MKYLIIPDVHHRVRTVDWIMERVKADVNIFLGDFMDDFDDTPKEAAFTANWLNQNILRKDCVFLVGNHDLAYMYPQNRGLYCSGFDKVKCDTVLKNLNIIDWRENTKLFHRIDNVIFSHAGISGGLIHYLIRKGWMEKMPETPEQLDEAIGIIAGSVRTWNESANMVHPLVDAGYDRGGKAESGGLTWCDFSSFLPIKNVVQVFGHTPIYPRAVALKLVAKNGKTCTTSYPEKESRVLNHLYQNGIGIDIDSHLCSFATWDSDTGLLDVFRINFEYDTYRSPIIPTKIISTEVVWSFNTKS